MEEDEDIANADFWKKSGDDYFQQGQYEKAIECYKEAIEINPNYRTAWNNLGFSYFRLGKLDEAKKCKDKINELKKAETVIQQEQEQPAQQIQPPTPQAVSKSKPADLPTSYQANFLLIALFIAGIVCIFIPLIGFLFVIAIVIASAYFVYKDAESIGAGRSPDSWSPVTFGLLVLLFWLIALPAYILMRKSIYEEGEAFSRGETVAKSKTSGLFIVLIILGVVVIFIILAAVIAAFIFGMAGSVASQDAQDSSPNFGTSTPVVTTVQTSSVTIATSTPRPTTQVTSSAPLRFTGSGDDLIAFSASGTGLRVFTMNYNGASNFIIWLKDSQGNLEDLLVNEIGSYSGKKSARLYSGTYYLDVTASGPWSIEISPSVTRIAPTSGRSLVLSGYGDDVKSFTATGTGLRVFTMDYNGGSNFIIWLKDSQGNMVDLLVNEIGSYSGKKSAQLSSGTYYLDITASGPWSIEIAS